MPTRFHGLWSSRITNHTLMSSACDPTYLSTASRMPLWRARRNQVHLAASTARWANKDEYSLCADSRRARAPPMPTASMSPSFRTQTSSKSHNVRDSSNFWIHALRNGAALALRQVLDELTLWEESRALEESHDLGGPGAGPEGGNKESLLRFSLNSLRWTRVSSFSIRVRIAALWALAFSKNHP